MKKLFLVFLLMLTVLGCSLWQPLQPSTGQTAAVSSEVIPTKASNPGLTTTPSFTASLGVTGAYLLLGPGKNYGESAFCMGEVTIIGQAYACQWFKVVSNSNPAITGWIEAEELTYTVHCPDVEKADIPATPEPTQTRTPFPPTRTPAPIKPTLAVHPTLPPPRDNPPASCKIDSNILISNRSGNPITLYLSGPANFTFNLAPDANTVQVCSGSYNYTVSGTCNGIPASGSGRISDGDNIYFYCN